MNYVDMILGILHTPFPFWPNALKPIRTGKFQLRTILFNLVVLSLTELQNGWEINTGCMHLEISKVGHWAVIVSHTCQPKYPLLSNFCPINFGNNFPVKTHPTPSLIVKNRSFCSTIVSSTYTRSRLLLSKKINFQGDRDKGHIKETSHSFYFKKKK